MRIRLPACAGVVSLLILAGHSAPGQEAKKGVTELEGVWKLVGLEASVQTYEVPPNLPRWVIKGDKVLYAGATLARLTVDGGTMPKAIDLNFVDKKRTYEGVYKIEGDKLSICVNRLTEGLKERPLDFTTEGDKYRRLLVFKREKPGADDGSKDAPGFVGVQIGIAPEDKGIIIVATLDKSPAKKAGLKKDDLIIRVGGTPATRLAQVVDLIRDARPGSELKLGIRRGAKEQDVTVRVGVLPFFLLE